MSQIKEYILSQLNEEQWKAAVHTETSSLILAGAGSGKTRVLTYKIAYMIYDQWYLPDEILAVTFTNKAANEMKHRLGELGKEISSKLDLPVRSYNYRWIGTFHGMFLRILKEIYADPAVNIWYNTNFGIYDDWEAKSTVNKIIKDLKLEQKVELDVARRMISKLKNEWITANKFLHMANTPQDEYIWMVYEQYEKELLRSNMMDFDDLLLQPYIIFRKHENLLANWAQKRKYIMVDEAQDTNWIQFELMKLLTSTGAKITFIGDDYQSIYRRRGAMMDNFLNVHKFWPDIITYKLQTNYRSKSHIVQAWNSVIANNRKQYEKNVVAHREWVEKIIHIENVNEYDEAKNIIDLIKKFKKDKNMTWSDFAILYRKNAQSASFEQFLITENIPYKIYGWFKFLDRKEIKDILWYMKFINNTSDNVSLKRIINTPARGISADTISKLEWYGFQKDLNLWDIMNNQTHLQATWIPSRAIDSITKFTTMINYIISFLDSFTPSQIIENIVNMTKYKEYLIEKEGKTIWQEKIENIWELINIASKYDL